MTSPVIVWTCYGRPWKLFLIRHVAEGAGGQQNKGGRVLLQSPATRSASFRQTPVNEE